MNGYLVLFVLQDAAHQVQQFAFVVNNQYLFSHYTRLISRLSAGENLPPPVFLTCATMRSVSRFTLPHSHQSSQMMLAFNSTSCTQSSVSCTISTCKINLCRKCATTGSATQPEISLVVITIRSGKTYTEGKRARRPSWASGHRLTGMIHYRRDLKPEKALCYNASD